MTATAPLAVCVPIARPAVAILVGGFLATEEPLKKVHETPETPLTTAIFFVGFLVIVLFDLLTSSAGA